jgi:hypothetical protein
MRYQYIVNKRLGHDLSWYICRYLLNDDRNSTCNRVEYLLKYKDDWSSIYENSSYVKRYYNSSREAIARLKQVVSKPLRKRPDLMHIYGRPFVFTD